VGEESSLRCRFVQVYNDQVIDLLNPHAAVATAAADALGANGVWGRAPAALTLMFLFRLAATAGQ
jgi:hypothetical protein